MKHTSGPWALETVKTSCGICHKIGDFSKGRNRKNTYGCVYDDYPSGDASREIEANAKLMAAAPDLLAACVEFCRKVDAGEARSTKSYAQMAAAIERATQ